MELNDTIKIILDQIKQPLWEHWYIKDRIGTGAYSCVFKVEAQRSARRVNTAALKIQPITANGRVFINDDDKRAYIERQKQRTDAEAEIMCSLRRFPNIVFYEDEDVRELIIDGQFEGYYSLLRMELLTSVVEQIHKRKFDFSQENLVKLACDIGRGISDAHSVGIIHRDIKTDNFFVDDYGTYKLGDFNVAKISDSARTIAGTPGYIAPEVYRAKSDIDAEYTAQADIYSFGICLYRLANDLLYPFEGDDCDTDTAHSKRYKGEALPAPKNADEKFARIILKACAFSTDERYGDMGEMLRELSQLSGSAVSVQSAPRAAKVRTDDPERTILAEEMLLQQPPKKQISDNDVAEEEAPHADSVSSIDIEGCTIELGSYPVEQGGESKPLRWRILSIENGVALLITEKCVDACAFSDNGNASYWEDSFARRYLNGDFYEAAFTEHEKGFILDSELMNYKNVVFRTNSGGKTTDKVYLLSVEEAQRFFADDSERSAEATPLALSKGIFTSDDGKAWWWLRTSGSKDSYSADVDYGGDVDSYGSDRIASIEGLRPVIRVSLSFLNKDEIIALSESVSMATASMTITESIDVGEDVFFGKYNEEALRWQVLEVSENKALLITKEIIDALPYDSRRMNITWKQSELRRWLNFEFSEAALGNSISFVEEINVSTPANPVFGITGGMNTKDKIFLLSLVEAEKYFPSNELRTTRVSSSVSSKDIYIDDNGCGWWWLRSAGSNQHYAANVDYGGDIDFYGSDTTALNGVRPAMWVDISVLRKA